MTLCLEDAVRLLAAVARQWAADAQRDDHELALLASWLDMAPDDVRRRLVEDAERCANCGAPLKATRATRGRQRYCSRACGWAADNLRRRRIDARQK